MRGPRRIHLLVTCTNRKRQPPHPELTIRAATDTSDGRPWEGWRRRLETVDAPVLAAQDLYVGPHWHVARGVAAAYRDDPLVSLWVCSAGYGLIRPEAGIKPYSAVFTPGSEDSVSRLLDVRDNADAVRRWWEGLAEWPGPHPNGPRRVADLARLDPDSVVIVALSPSYLAACRDDLAEAYATLGNSDRLLLVCPGANNDSRTPGPDPLPIDGRAAGFLGGTMGTLGARFVRHLIGAFSWNDLRASYLRPRLEQWLTTLTPRRVPIRARHDDSEVAEFIRERLIADLGSSATGLLREFRGLGEACEQKRFHAIYSDVKGEIDVG